MVGVALVYFVMSALVKWQGIRVIEKLFPPVVIGPVIILIGLSLAGTGVNMAKENWTLALLSLLTAVIVSMKAKGLLKLIPIFCGIIVGYLAAWLFYDLDLSGVRDAAWIGLPQFVFPKFSWEPVLFMIPVAIAPVIEHIGDVYVVNTVAGKDFVKDPGLHRSLFADNFSTMISGFIGSVPTTTYGENIGVMAITKVYSVRVIGGAAVLSIICSFVGPLAALIQTIPGPVIGGISFLLYGMIGTSGLRILVDNHVDYSKNRNMILTSVIFVTGLSGVTLALGDVSLSGMTLAAIVGMIMSLVFYAFDKFHLSNDA